MSPSLSFCAEEQRSDAELESKTQTEGEGLPEVDMSLSAEELIPLLHSAAASWGFFRIFNHGLPLALIDSISAHFLRFFSLPLDDKLAIRREPPGFPTGYTSIVGSTVNKAWCEALLVMPGKDRICGLLDRVPLLPDRASFCADLMEYFDLIGALAKRIIYLLFRGLDVDEAEVKAVLADNVESSWTRINYYPAYPSPDFMHGIPPHRDFAGLTILHQDDVGGLEVFKDGHWVGVKPEKGYLIVNVGDLSQVLSNARYKSVLHRAVLNSLQPRLSFGFFWYPSEERLIAPMSKCVTKDSPAKYKPFVIKDYKSMFATAQKAGHSAALFSEEKP